MSNNGNLIIRSADKIRAREGDIKHFPVTRNPFCSQHSLGP